MLNMKKLLTKQNYGIFNKTIKMSGSPKLLCKNRKITFSVPRSHYLRTRNRLHTRKLLRHCQLPDKSSCDISTDTWIFSSYFKILFIYSTISRRNNLNYIFRNSCWGKIRYVIPHSVRQVIRLQPHTFTDWQYRPCLRWSVNNGKHKNSSCSHSV
jgi:hypothetical protein